MNDELKKKYRVLKAVAISGIVNPGEIVELTEAEATNIGIGEYLEEVTDQETDAGDSSDKSPDATGNKGEYADDEGSEEKDPTAGDGEKEKSGE